jgi:RNA-directed DNA polymerase
MNQQTAKPRPANRRTERYGTTSSPLYGIKSHTRLAAVLHWVGTTGQLRTFSRRPDNYSRYIDKSKPGKDRLIEAPAVRLKEFQSRLLVLLSRIELPGYLHSARPGFSYLSNSAAHCEAEGSTVTMDIDSFYQSVTVQRVARFFEQKLQCAPDVSETLAHLLCCDKHLATGSPASPLVSFWAYRELFDSVDDRVRSRGGIFTLYIDDMGITGNGFGHTDANWVGRLLRRSGLRLKEAKTRVFRADAAKLITGRACRNGVSRAPNKQHRKMREAQAKLEQNPADSTLRASVAGLKRHLALLDDKDRARHRAEASRISKGS